MEEIIKINYDAEQPTVSARDLYDLLSSEGGLSGTERFSKWFDRYIKYGFRERVDYSTPYKKVRVQSVITLSSSDSERVGFFASGDSSFPVIR